MNESTPLPVASAAAERRREAAARPPRAKPYLWLLLLFPALAVAGHAWWRYSHFEQGGTVSAIKLTIKEGFVGQAAQAQANVNPITPDLYLKVALADERELLELPVKNKTPVGNGLTWDLPAAMPIARVTRVEVFDHHVITSDTPLDHITLGGWSTDGQRYHVDLVGKPNAPPAWAFPTFTASAAVAGVVLLKFIWDQAI